MKKVCAIVFAVLSVFGFAKISFDKAADDVLSRHGANRSRK